MADLNTSQTKPKLNETTPSVRKAGTYQVKLTDSAPLRTSAGLVTAWYCHVYRNDQLVTTVRTLTAEGAVSEARRNVRNARKCGGL
jgi:hypothetical protein